MQICRLYSVTQISIDCYFDVFRTLNDMRIVYSNANAVGYSLHTCQTSLAISMEDVKTAFIGDAILKRFVSEL